MGRCTVGRFSGSGEQTLEIGAFLEADRVVQWVPGAFDFAQRSVGSFGGLMDGCEKPVGAYAAGTGSESDDSAGMQNAQAEARQAFVGGQRFVDLNLFPGE